jgi:hypothetical protein
MKKIFYILSLLFVALACSKSKEEQALDSIFFKDVPSVFIVRAAEEVGFTTAKIIGNIKDNGTSQNEDFGLCYATSPSPTVNNTKVAPSVVVFRFKEDNAVVSNFSNLQPNTRYYVRGYITTNGKITYTNEISFQTLLPFRVTTSDLQVSSPRGASAKGTVLGIGNGSRVVTYGVVAGNAQNPTTQNNLFISQQTGQNLTRDFSFTSTFDNLQPNTTYHLRAFAVDVLGYTAYGENLTFTTPQETRVISLNGDFNFGNININQTSSQRILTINNTGNTDLVINNLTFSIAGFAGNFSGTILPNRSQSVAITFTPTQAIAYNGTITVNGNQTSGVNVINISGTGILPVVLPAVQTVNFSGVTQNAVSFDGNLSNLGNAATCQIGFVYSAATQTPTLAHIQTAPTNVSNPTAFSAGAGNLTPNTTYYFRAYATNSAGTVYGAVQSFRTGTNIVQPTVQTISATNITSIGATITGRLNTLGSFNSVNVGFFYSHLTSDPGVSGTAYRVNMVSPLTSASNYTTGIGSLLPNTLHYYRAFAETSAGMVFGNVLSFTTPAAPFIAPQVETVSAAFYPNSPTFVAFRGNLLSLGSATSVNVGFEWSTDGGNNFGQGAGAGTRNTVGNFTGDGGGFQLNQSYSYRAYATYIENNQTKKVVGITRLIVR